VNGKKIGETAMTLTMEEALASRGCWTIGKTSYRRAG
jgi:hypothetical protein